MKTFKELPLIPEIQKSIDALGFEKPTEIQAKVIPILLEKKTDIHAQAQTGTGKTIAFGIPLLQAIDQSVKGVQALIVAPTRELVLQIYEHLKDISRGTKIIIEPVFGGMPIQKQISNIKRGAQIIVGTPGRLNDHLRRKTISLKSLETLVLDEADIMLDMGFKEEIDSILKYAPKNRMIWLFSATVKPGIKRLINSHMKDVISVKATKKEELSPQVKQYYCVVPMRNRVAATARFVESAPGFYGIIFCKTKILTSEVMERLVSRGFKANCLHGDMSQALRNQVIKGFKNKDFTILVATDVAARGIDVSDLTHVINFSVPDEHETYIHRIGRTGRAGKEGVAILFVGPSELYQVRRLERSVNTSLQEIPIPPIEAIINAKMGAVSDFIEQSKEQPDKKLSSVHTALNTLIDSFTQEELSKALVIALADKFFKDIVREDKLNVSSPMTLRPQEICMEIGQDTGFTEQQVRDYLYPTCKLLPQEVQKVRVLNNKTFISIPDNRLHDCMAAMQKKPITSKKYKIYLVEDRRQQRRPQGKPRKRTDRSDRFGKPRRTQKSGRYHKPKRR